MLAPSRPPPPRSERPRSVRTPLARTLAAAGAGVVVGYAYVVHVRGLIMLGVHLLALLAAVYFDRRRWKVAVSSLAVALVVTRIDWIAQNIVGVATAASSTSEGATDTQKAAAELTRMAVDLQRLVGRFTV